MRVLYNRRGVSDYSLYDEAGIIERTGVVPSLYPMLAALRGDPSDNLPGVPGVGEKTAAKLLNTYGDLDGIFSNLAALTPKLRENLAEGEPLARSNALVIPLVRDVPMGVSLSELTLGGWDLDTARQVFDDLELKTVWTRLEPLLADGSFGAPAAGSAVPARATPAPDEKDGLTTGPAAGSTPEAPPPDALPAGERRGGRAGPGRAGGVGDGPLFLAGHWAGAVGRSPLSGVALASGDPPSAAVWLDGERLGEPEVLDALRAAWARRAVAGHQVKELFRSLLERGVDCPELLMDTAVAAYLLDPSAGDYSIDAVALPWLDRSALGERPAAAKGQLALGSTRRPTTPRGPSARRARPRSWWRRCSARSTGGAAHPARRGGAPARRRAGPHGGGRDPGRHRRAAPHRRRAGRRDGHARDRDPGAGRARVQRELDPAAAHRALRRAGAHPRPQDQDRLLDRRRRRSSRCATTTRSSRPCCATASSRSSAPPTARACWPRWRPTAASTPRSARRWPAPAGSPRSGPTCTTSRCAPRPAAGSAGPSCRPRATGSWSPTTTRSSCG